MKRGRFSIIFNRPAPWLPPPRAHTVPVAVSTRVRLARNLADTPFPGQAPLAARQAVLERVADVVGALDLLGPGWLAADMGELGDLERRLLGERRLISRDLGRLGTGAGVIIRKDEQLSLMVNEEDHVRFQVILPGFRLKEAWRVADAADTACQSRLPFAFRPDLGFLTACPSNLGTGLRASVLLHLPALVLTERLEPAGRAARELGLTVRGLYGEGTDAVGGFFQLSNQSTLGDSEATLLDRLDGVVRKLVDAEETARQELAANRRELLLDRVGRAYGILRHAWLLSTQDAIQNLSFVLLGCALGLFSALESRNLHELMVLIQPGHLQKAAKKNLDEAARDALRARLVRQYLQQAGNGGAPAA